MSHLRAIQGGRTSPPPRAILAAEQCDHGVSLAAPCLRCHEMTTAKLDELRDAISMFLAIEADPTSSHLELMVARARVEMLVDGGRR